MDFDNLDNYGTLFVLYIPVKLKDENEKEHYYSNEHVQLLPDKY